MLEKFWRLSGSGLFSKNTMNISSKEHPLRPRNRYSKVLSDYDSLSWKSTESARQGACPVQLPVALPWLRLFTTPCPQAARRDVFAFKFLSSMRGDRGANAWHRFTESRMGFWLDRLNRRTLAPSNRDWTLQRRLTD